MTQSRYSLAESLASKVTARDAAIELVPEFLSDSHLTGDTFDVYSTISTGWVTRAKDADSKLAKREVKQAFNAPCEAASSLEVAFKYADQKNRKDCSTFFLFVVLFKEDLGDAGAQLKKLLEGSAPGSTVAVIALGTGASRDKYLSNLTKLLTPQHQKTVYAKYVSTPESLKKSLYKAWRVHLGLEDAEHDPHNQTTEATYLSKYHEQNPKKTRFVVALDTSKAIEDLVLDEQEVKEEKEKNGCPCSLM